MENGLKAIASAEVSFEKQFNGYAKEQVDRYITHLASAYQTAYNEYQTVCAKYNNLLEDYKKLEAREQDRPDADVITKTLVNTEKFAQKILADAQIEAEKIKLEARIEAEAKRAAAQKLIDDAAVKAARINVSAKQNMEVANEEIARLIKRMQGLTAPETTGALEPQMNDLSSLISLRNIGA
jgi:cell division septum initiation protein DivIVA